MIIKGLLTDRQPLIRNLEKLTGTKASYSGAPSFVYLVGEYKVTRNGDIDCDNPNAAIIEQLITLGLVAPLGPSESAVPSASAVQLQLPHSPDDEPISVPLTDFTGRTMMNIVNALASKGDLLNKSVGGSFHMSPVLVAMLKAENPASLDDFRRILYHCGGENAMAGLRLTADTLFFPGFPTPPDAAHKDAWTSFTSCLVSTAKAAHHLKGKPLATTNDKYTFRTWLNTLGMKGEAFKGARAILMERIEGDGSFKTEGQREAFYKLRKRRREPAFVAL